MKSLSTRSVRHARRAADLTLLAFVCVLLGAFASNAVRAVTYDWSEPWAIESDFSGPTVTGQYQDLKISVSDPDPNGWWGQAKTDTQNHRLSFQGAGWGADTPPQVMTIEKADGFSFTLAGTMTVYYDTFEPTAGNYERRTATIRGLNGTTETGKVTHEIQGLGSFDLVFANLTGFSNITKLEFNNGAGGLAIGPTVIPGANSPPTDISLSSSTIDATAASAGATIATLSSIDPDSSETFAYSLVSGAGATNNASFTITGSTLKIAGSALAAGAYGIRIRSTDSATNVYEEAFTISVIDDVPPAIVSIKRHSPAGQAINAGPVVFRVTYSEPVTNVTAANFAIEAINGGSIAGSVSNIFGAGATRDVTVSITSGSGEFRLNVVHLD